MCIAGNGIEANAGIQLAKIHRAEVQRARVTLLNVVRTIHQAAEVDAVRDAELAGFMGQHLATAAQNDAGAIRGGFAIEARIVSREGYTPTRSRSEAWPKTKFHEGAG